MRAVVHREYQTLFLLGVYHSAIIVRKPLLIVRKVGEVLSKHAEFLYFLRAARCFQPLCIFCCFGAILLGRKHRQIFLVE